MAPFDRGLWGHPPGPPDPPDPTPPPPRRAEPVLLLQGRTFPDDAGQEQSIRVALATDVYTLADAVALLEHAITTRSEMGLLQADGFVFDFDPRRFRLLAVHQGPASSTPRRALPPPDSERP